MLPRRALRTLLSLARGFPVLAITGSQQFGLMDGIGQSLAVRAPAP